jgi:hypothetical protein
MNMRQFWQKVGKVDSVTWTHKDDFTKYGWNMYFMDNPTHGRWPRSWRRVKKHFKKHYIKDLKCSVVFFLNGKNCERAYDLYMKGYYTKIFIRQ